MNRIWKKNITLDYIFCFSRNFNVTNAIWVLYMVYKGVPLWQVGITEGVFHLASFLFEVPSGAAADLLGRKRVCILGRIFAAVSSVMILSSSSVLGFSIAFVFSALSYNLNSGSEEALVYDTMKAMQQEKDYIQVNSRLNIIMEVSQGMATVVGGILAEYSYALCYTSAIVITLISLIPVCMLKEPPMSEQEEKIPKTSIKEHFAKSYHVVRENPAVIKILLYYPMVAAFYTVLYFYGQQYLSENGMNKVEISIVMLSGSLASCLGAFCSGGLLNRWKGKTKYMAAFLMSASIACVSIPSIVVVIIAFFMASFVNALLYPIESSSLNALIPSEQRATIISVDSMCFSMSMIIFFPLSGWLATVANLRTTFLVLGAVEFVMTCLVLAGRRRCLTREQPLG